MSQAKSEMVPVRVTPEEKDLFTAAAARRNKSASALGRELLLPAIAHERAARELEMEPVRQTA